VACCQGRLNVSIRIKVRAGMEVGEQLPPGYIDRKGMLHLPMDAALEMARRFCCAEPAPVLLDVETTEREWSAKASRPGDEYIVPPP
jgi:hypothetical protein